MHLYPGLSLDDLYKLNFTELGMLIGGLEWVMKWHVMLSPFKDKKTKIKIPDPIDFYHGEDLLRDGKIPREKYLEIQRKLVREAAEPKRGR